jgi:hypothetical protein
MYQEGELNNALFTAIERIAFNFDCGELSEESAIEKMDKEIQVYLPEEVHEDAMQICRGFMRADVGSGCELIEFLEGLENDSK